ncbi:hypothetical protein DXG01_007827 [Tephrocybe rancida]|nr:hypothetical protein DXG01_007827 [Tephrocybe rancida]
MAAQMSGAFYGSGTVEDMLSDTKFPLQKICDLLMTAIKAKKAGSLFDMHVFLLELWPQFLPKKKSKEESITSKVTTTGDVVRVIPEALTFKEPLPVQRKVKLTKLEAQQKMSTSNAKDDGAHDSNRAAVSTYICAIQNEAKGNVEEEGKMKQVTYKTFLNDLEDAQMTLLGYPAGFPFPGILPGCHCFGKVTSIESKLLSLMARTLNISNPACPTLQPWTDEQKSLSKDDPDYRKIPLIETGPGRIEPSIIIAKVDDAQKNCEAYVRMHGKQELAPPPLPLVDSNKDIMEIKERRIVLLLYGDSDIYKADHLAPLPVQHHNHCYKDHQPVQEDGGVIWDALPQRQPCRAQGTQDREDRQPALPEDGLFFDNGTCECYNGGMPYVIDNNTPIWEDSDGVALPAIGLRDCPIDLSTPSQPANNVYGGQPSHFALYDSSRRITHHAAPHMGNHNDGVVGRRAQAVQYRDDVAPGPSHPRRDVRNVEGFEVGGYYD